MITKLALTVALLLAAATAVSAQDTTPPAGGGGDAPSTETSEPVVGAHGPVTDCPHTDSSCVWGRLVSYTGRAGATRRGKRMQEGPIDVCHFWDYSCSAPVQTVCELHGPHGANPGHWSEEGSFFFVLRTNRSWRLKPRVAGSHRSWRPPEKIISRGATPGSVGTVDFSLVSGWPSTSICD